jgi:hypothetical protein
LIINHDYRNIPAPQATSDREARMFSTNDNCTDFPVVAHLATGAKTYGPPTDSLDLIEGSPDV